MTELAEPRSLRDLPRLPVKLNSPEFTRGMYDHYQWMLDEAPICRGKIAMIDLVLVAPYDECRSLLRDPRLLRDRAAATGGRSFPFPLPRGVRLMLKGLITQDDPVHRRQRTLVAKAFTPKALARLEDRVGEIVTELLDGLEGQRRVDLLQAYCLPIPVTVIQEMLGVAPEDMPRFQNLLSDVSDGLTGLSMIKTMLWNFPKTIRYVDELLERKRKNPGDDILTALIEAEEGGDRLSHDELVAMTLTLVIAGYETTVHLIGNAVVTLLRHPEQLAALASDLTLADSAIEEVLRYQGPIQGTKPNYAAEDIELMGVKIPRGTAVIPMLGAASRDPAVFTDPLTFDIRRQPNKHLGFGYGVHHCLGAALARMEGRVAVARLIERLPNLRLDPPPGGLRQQAIPLWHRYQAVPVTLHER